MRAEVKHDLDGKRFFALVNGLESNLFYEKITDKLWELKQTLVPIELRGLGISQEIFKHVFDFASKNDIKLRLSCLYAQVFVSFNGQFNNLLAA